MNTTTSDLSLAEGAFDGRRVYPYRFLMRHYTFRSQAQQGERKIFKERRPRRSLAEHARGWHYHYDLYPDGHVFIRNPADLHQFDDTFYRTLLVERLTSNLHF
jgi:hypothetical protein